MKSKILIVDDNKGVRREIGYLLEDEGYSVTQVDNGEQACLELFAERFDLIITDVLMPEMDGFELMTFIRSKYPDLKTIAISGGGQSYIESTHGVDDLLRQVDKICQPDAIFKKPFQSENLIKMVNSLLKNSNN